MDNLDFENNVKGILFVVASLLFDGLTSSQTDKHHKETSRDYAYSIMFTNNFVALIMNLVFYALTCIFWGDDTIERIIKYPALL